MSVPPDADLAGKLNELQRKYVQYDDVIAAWEAIGRIAARNKDRLGEPYPTPSWLNEYLLRCADKIGRLSLGIHPVDDRSLLDIPFYEVGQLRKVPQSDGEKAVKAQRFRDERTKYIGAALGFTGSGRSVFQQHDRMEHDEQLLRAYDNDCQGNKAMRDQVRAQLYELLRTQEDARPSPAAVRNRLSKARTARRDKSP